MLVHACACFLVGRGTIQYCAMSLALSNQLCSSCLFKVRRGVMMLVKRQSSRTWDESIATIHAVPISWFSVTMAYFKLLHKSECTVVVLDLLTILSVGYQYAFIVYPIQRHAKGSSFSSIAHQNTGVPKPCRLNGVVALPHSLEYIGLENSRYSRQSLLSRWRRRT